VNLIFTICKSKLFIPEKLSKIVSHFRDVFPFVNESLVPDEDIAFVEFVEGNYTGQIKGDGFRHGWGEMLWENATLYGPGECQKSYLSLFPPSSLHHSFFQHQIPDDIFYYTLGDKYFGQWNYGCQEGIGTFFSQTGVYVGDWSNGLQNGKAHVFLNNGNK